MSDDQLEHFRQRYGARAVDNGMRLRPRDFLDEVAWRDRIDQHYTRAWLDFTYGGVFARKVLDERTRLLVSIAQFLCLDELDELARQVPSALEHGATPREVLEVILQATVYIGYLKAGRGARRCMQVLGELGRLDEVTDTQLPLEGRTPERSLEVERQQWPAPVDEEEAALREQLLEKYGWSAISCRVRVQSHQGYEAIKRFDRVDPEYLRLWFNFIYADMYPRQIVDDRTRLLVMVGNCLALHEPVQLENHMRGALLFGATPSEVLEVILNSTAYVGMPTTVLTAGILERILREQGRLEELSAGA
ncbi:MAG: carboxymuconolactone decarboxylase family protein [Chloroflexi bacterium]|nr:carboxymuconolactone decarboxylase family protein [Chloroflexota bacterium]